MGLQEVMQNAAQTAILAVGNIATYATFISAGTVEDGTKSYNVTTGATTATDTEYKTKMIFDSYTAFEKQNMNILSTDKKALIANLDLTPTPKAADRILQNNIYWEIKEISTDPAKALWQIQIREP